MNTMENPHQESPKKAGIPRWMAVIVGLAFWLIGIPLLGWTIFYGSLAVFLAFVVACAFFNFIHVPREEHALEARFGEAYREYKGRIPRRFGKIPR